MTLEDKIHAYNMIEKARAVLQDLDRTTDLHPSLKCDLNRINQSLGNLMQLTGWTPGSGAKSSVDEV